MRKVFYSDCSVSELESEVADLTKEIESLEETVQSFTACAKRASLPFMPVLELSALVNKRQAVLDIIRKRNEAKEVV